MGIRFSKSIKINKLLRINFTKNGISATIGKRGASVNIGGKGTYLNLSPAAVGVKGTGISYRTKIAGGLFKKNKKKSSVEKTSSLKKKEEVKEIKNVPEVKEIENVKEVQEIEDVQDVTVNELSAIEEYEQMLEAETNLHKYTENVMNEEQFKDYIASLESEASREIYRLSADGDEDTVENLVSTFMNNLQLTHNVRVNYELEGDVLYADLDLPEIEELKIEYPKLSRDKIVYRRKTSAQLREEYARMVMSIGVFLTTNFFNLSSYIRSVVMSGFNTVRDSKGDLVDQYLYSVKFKRDVFEKTDLSTVDDLYDFFLKFDNRINLSSNHNFKAIVPYEMESVTLRNSLIEDAVLGLKELGYKAGDINTILPQLSQNSFDTSGEYLKEGLRLLNQK